MKQQMLEKSLNNCHEMMDLVLQILATSYRVEVVCTLPVKIEEPYGRRWSCNWGGYLYGGV